MRILIFGMTENPGGVESFLVNYYRHIDRSKIQFDFLCNSMLPVAYEDELIKLGGRTFHITARSQNPMKYKKELELLFKQHSTEWECIWVNVCSLANVDYLKIAKKYGIKRRIIHSHNSQNMDSKLRGFLHEWNKKKIDKLATDFWACSSDAANWFYPEHLMSKVKIIYNAIDLNKIKFDLTKRNFIREKYGFQNKFIIGNVGRLHFQKNQSFLLDVFKKYSDVHSDAILVLIGDGEDKAMLQEKVERLQIKDKVFFMGLQKDIQAWLSTFDLFLFPSKFEGLSIAALEAQGNGLPVLASNGVIPEDVRINKNFYFLDLSEKIDKWVEQISLLKNERIVDAEVIEKKFTEKGFNIETEVLKLEQELL